MQKVNLFCTENEHMHAFYAPTTISYKFDELVEFMFVSEENRPLLLAKGVSMFTAFMNAN